MSITLATALFDLLGRFLGAPSDEVEDIVNAASYDPFHFPAFGAKSPYSNPCDHFDPTTESIVSMCEQDLEPSCQNYCKTVLNITLQMKVKELFELSSRPVGLIQPGFPHVLLPVCKYPVLDGSSDPHECWRKVVNDLGVCYASRTG